MNGNVNGLYGGITDQSLSGIDNGTGYGVANGIYTDVQNKQIVRNGLVLYLDATNRQSYNGSSSVWNDLSGLGNNGSLINGPTFTTLNGGGIVFDGSNDYVQINATGINVGNTFTHQCWAYFYDMGGRVTPTGAFERESLISNSYPYTTNTGFVIIASSQAPPPSFAKTPGYEHFFVSLGNDQKFAASALGSLSINKWFNLAVRVNSTELIKLYINGDEVNQYQNQTDANISLTYNNICAIGGRVATSVTSSDFLNGILPITMLYNRALTNYEIKQNYLATKSKFNL
jgi:hypothetical protein